MRFEVGLALLLSATFALLLRWLCGVGAKIYENMLFEQNIFLSPLKFLKECFTHGHTSLFCFTTILFFIILFHKFYYVPSYFVLFNYILTCFFLSIYQDFIWLE